MKKRLLRLVVYLDAARLSPRLWLTALWWRILGKRVRSRAQFGPLLGASPRAYRLWLQDEAALDMTHREADPAIVAVVGEGQGRDETVRSVGAEGIAVLCDAPGADFAYQGRYAPLWLMWLEAGDALATGAGDAYRAAIAANGHARVIYADDDVIDTRGRRTQPHFKPEWNPELLRHHDYVTGAAIVRVDAAALRAVLTHCTAASLAAKAATCCEPQEVVRLPRVLHHRRIRPAPRVPAVPTLREWQQPGTSAPKVSVIVPTRNRLDLLRTCIDGLMRTNYPSMEVIVVDNGSDDPAALEYLAALGRARFEVLRDDGPFNFSRLNNRAARLATGEVLCLLNNDIEVFARDWLEIMVRQALRPEVGAVGACLLYPDGRIQHAGVVLGICGGAAHAHRLLRPEAEGYFRRHALPQFVSAVTAACLVVRRESFVAVGGLDEENFAVAFNDVDLCMRLNQRGWQSLYEPRATLVHHESVSRGFDRDPIGAARLASELAALKVRWGTGDMDRQVDPFHHPQLSRYSERFAIRLNS
ncbi:glycosyltransferase family 2 protein [Novosphingobium pentaromativorans]|uniref:Glycosyl transferase, group 2 family protein n=1 Tax=Novosphingobium pentaromativorans US6-1 TaxID=1088721 RepID=G6EKN7_9SPHN|nr:glycosyltransferase family 2 protein [Novosphingobium pentaromativorans]AIT82831.1 glycosyl transferase [Novosphingobium pentaromativorans US6-1]EHJ58130.1 glycosyl transferase, group 2 family protein [Novosphingobium pentaromativorans US6-1]